MGDNIPSKLLDDVDQDVTVGASPVLAVTNMSGSAAGLDSNATTHAGLTTTAHGLVTYF